MKKNNFILAAVFAFLVIFTSSCLDSNNNSNYDAAEYMTIEGSMPFYDVYGESGTKYEVSNPSDLIVKDQQGNVYNYHRAFIYFNYDDNNKDAKVRKISVVAVNPITESKVSFQKDTLKLNTDNEIDTEAYQPFVKGNWVSYNRGYLSVNFNYIPQQGIATNNFVLVIDKVVDNSLNLRLVNTMKRDDSGYITNSFPYIISYFLDVNHLRYEYRDEINPEKNVKVSVYLDLLQDGVKMIGENPLDLKLFEFEL